MILTILFVVTGGVGLAILVVEVRGVLHRRRVEREWRDKRGHDRA
ncbi:MAG: hypothetical protein ABIR79_19605 [Candidatus Binatia bacterium]